MIPRTSWWSRSAGLLGFLGTEMVWMKEHLLTYWQNAPGKLLMSPSSNLTLKSPEAGDPEQCRGEGGGGAGNGVMARG